MFLELSQRLKNGKDVYIENYENSISDVMKITNYQRDKVIDMLLSILTKMQ